MSSSEGKERLDSLEAMGRSHYSAGIAEVSQCARRKKGQDQSIAVNSMVYMLDIESFFILCEACC